MGFPRQSTNHVVLSVSRKAVKIAMVRSRGIGDVLSRCLEGEGEKRK